MQIPASKMVAVPSSGSLEDRDELQVWRNRLQDGLNDRKRYEPTWHLCQSFLAGRQWVGWSHRSQRIVELPNPGDRERHTADVLTQYHQTVLGKLYVEDLRPDLLFTREDFEAETVAEHSRKVAKFAWDSEVEADKRLYLGLHKMAAYGTSALRCCWDPSQGDPVGDFPMGQDGSPILDPQKARELVAQAQLSGQTMGFTQLKAGRIYWEVLSPLMLVPPPGVEEPHLFPWLIVQKATSLAYIKLRWPNVGDIPEEPNLRVADARDVAIETSPELSPAGSGQLKEHVVLNTGFEMPTRQYPQGRTITWIQDKKLEGKDKLPYKLKGVRHHGVVFYRYHLVPGRFWGQGVVEPLIGPQRQRTRARSQMIEMKDRNLGRVYARKGSLTPANKPVGKIMELVEIPLHSDFPQEVPGVPVGPWIANEAEINDVDMDKISGLREVSQGTNPTGVQAYSAMALLAEQDERRIGPVLKDVRNSVGDNVLLTLELIKEYWPNGKQLSIVGPEGSVEQFVYDRAKLPAEFYIDVSNNSPLPTSPAAESQKIFDVFNAATSSGQPLPVDWLKDSLDAGKALPLPKREAQVQQRKAEMENYFIHAGQQMIPDPFDDDMLHVQVHRAERFNQMNVPGTENYVAMLQEHEQMHLQQLARKNPTASGGMGGATQLPQAQGPQGAQSQAGPVTDQAALAQSQTGTAPVGQPAPGAL